MTANTIVKGGRRQNQLAGMSWCKNQYIFSQSLVKFDSQLTHTHINTVNYAMYTVGFTKLTVFRFVNKLYMQINYYVWHNGDNRMPYRIDKGDR